MIIEHDSDYFGKITLSMCQWSSSTHHQPSSKATSFPMGTTMKLRKRFKSHMLFLGLKLLPMFFTLYNKYFVCIL